MAGNSFGQLFKITTFGESHGKAIGAIIDGCPSGIKLDYSQIQSDLNRRKPGQSALVTQRKEPDEFEILSGTMDGVTTGTPLCIVVWNTNQKSKDYSHIKDLWRPSHADFTYEKKYGVRDYRGGGRSSARETIARVATGAIAKQILSKIGISINAYVSQVGDLKLNKSHQELDFQLTESNDVRCPDPEMAKRMSKLIKKIKKEGNTVGGMVSCVTNNIPVGIGEPVFGKLHAVLSSAMMGINAVKGFEYGSGFNCVMMTGAEHNDVFEKHGKKFITKTNFSGGIQGGISNGMPIYFNVAFKPVATIMRDQSSVNAVGEEVTISGKGRHDPCVVPRAVPIVEAMTALVMVDQLMLSGTVKLDDILDFD
ncbi:MAG: chorismate synthase [Saprospiraceae bacterium]